MIRPAQIQLAPPRKPTKIEPISTKLAPLSGKKPSNKILQIDPEILERRQLDAAEKAWVCYVFVGVFTIVLGAGALFRLNSIEFPNVWHQDLTFKLLSFLWFHVFWLREIVIYVEGFSGWKFKRAKLAVCLALSKWIIAAIAIACLAITNFVWA